jgi:hypothetical protein
MGHLRVALTEVEDVIDELGGENGEVLEEASA